MMIDVALREIDVRAKFLQRFFEALRRRDRVEQTNERVAQSVERQSFASENILQIERFMRAFDHFGGTIVAPNASHQLEIRFTGIFCDKDVAGATEIARPLAQCSSGKQKFVSERRLPIDEHHVEPMLKMQILKSIIEQQGIDLPFIDREAAAFYPVLIHDHNYIL